MKLATVNLAAGNAQDFGWTGNYFRVISSPIELNVEFPELAIKTQYLAGLGMKLPNAFKSVRLTAELDCQVRVMYGFGEVDDSRLTGDVDINGLLSVVNAGGSSYLKSNVTLVAATAAPVLAANTNRLKATLQPDVDIYIGVDATVTAADGILIKAGGSVEVDNTAALYGYSVGGGLVRVLEDLK